MVDFFISNSHNLTQCTDGWFLYLKFSYPYTMVESCWNYYSMVASSTHARHLLVLCVPVRAPLALRVTWLLRVLSSTFFRRGHSSSTSWAKDKEAKGVVFPGRQPVARVFWNQAASDFFKGLVLLLRLIFVYFISQLHDNRRAKLEGSAEPSARHKSKACAGLWASK